MKRLTCLAIALVFGLTAMAQQAAHDIVIKLNGEEMTGKVTEMSDDHIKFVYKGETLSYTVPKSEILKIKFASGREQIITKVENNAPANAPASTSKSTAEERKNKLAILPFHFIADREAADEEVSYKVQEEAFSLLSSHAGELQLQATSTTNALLLKVGINQSNFRAFTPMEICDLLGVEYIIQGTITLMSGTVTSSQSSSGTVNTKNNTGKTGTNRNTTVSGSSYSSTHKDYKTSVNLTVFNDKGSSIFSNDHTAMWNTPDAYKITINYLLKRTPVYKK